MEDQSAWLYHNLGTIAQIFGFAAIILIGVLSFLRKWKSRKLRRQEHKSVQPKRNVD